MFVSFGLMHMVATNLCVWLRYLVIEVLEGLHHEEEQVAADAHYSEDNITGI